MSMKLYKVTLQGMTTTVNRHGVSYVVATNLTDAYLKVLVDLGERKLGFKSDRELRTVELIAEDIEYPDCNARLYIDINQ